MSLFVLDTDILTLYYHGDPIVVRNVDARPPTELIGPAHRRHCPRERSGGGHAQPVRLWPRPGLERRGLVGLIAPKRGDAPYSAEGPTAPNVRRNGSSRDWDWNPHSGLAAVRGNHFGAMKTTPVPVFNPRWPVKMWRLNNRHILTSCRIRDAHFVIYLCSIVRRY
jgi:hypothetical protein